jgi:hypothetical protein
MKQEQFERAKVLLEELEKLYVLKTNLQECTGMQLVATRRDDSVLRFWSSEKNEAGFTNASIDFVEYEHPVTEKIIDLSVRQMLKSMLEQVEADIKLREEEFERL